MLSEYALDIWIGYIFQNFGVITTSSGEVGGPWELVFSIRRVYLLTASVSGLRMRTTGWHLVLFSFSDFLRYTTRSVSF